MGRSHLSNAALDGQLLALLLIVSIVMCRSVKLGPHSPSLRSQGKKQHCSVNTMEGKGNVYSVLPNCGGGGVLKCVASLVVVGEVTWEVSR